MPPRTTPTLSPRTGAARQPVALAMAIAAAFAVALALTAPFAGLPTRGTEILLPAYAAAALVLESLTAALLLACFNVQRAPALLALASGYLFSALLLPAWALTFPGVFAGLGIDAGLQATALIAAVRRLGFPLFVLGYALAPAGPLTPEATGGWIAASVLAVAAAAALATGGVLAGTGHLPDLMADARTVRIGWHIVPATALVLYGLAFAILATRRRTALDVWMCLVLFSLAIELALISWLGGAVRLGVGWWAGRLYGLTSASIVLLVLVSETTAVYARLAQSLAAEARTRQNHLTTMEALSASIAHEINQPLASIVTSADAGLRWLARAEPRLDQVEAALHRIGADGHRASKVVTSVRAMFLKEAQERAPLDLNDLVRTTVATRADEARHARIHIELELAPDLPPVIGNAVQLRQVICNLVENALEALAGAGDRPRRLTVSTRSLPFGEVEVAVADTGPGLDPAIVPRIFEPFFSTKPGGMGMGLMFCRAIVEAHGGRIRTEPAQPRGTVFLFSLPGAILEPAPAPASEAPR